MSAGKPYSAGVKRTLQPPQAYAQQLTEHLPNIRNFIASRVYNHQDVDDLLHDTLVRSLTAAAKRPVDNLLAYSLTVARSVVFDYWNRNRQQPSGCDSVPEMASVSLDEEHIQAQKLEQFEKILQQLPPLRRQVFIMRRLQGKSREDIARELNMNVEAVKKHITRATLSIAEAMEKSGC